MSDASPHYDAVIIGAGLSGLAAGIRLAHFGRRVCLLERHNVVGGLNSFYSIGGRKYDVGLHAMTNYVPPDVRGAVLGRILRQLRIDRADLDLRPQRRSVVRFPGVELAFTNDPRVLESEVARAFPREIDGYRALVAEVAAMDPDRAAVESGRAILRRHLRDPFLEDLLLCPLLFYGSASEHDMDGRQFAIMFRALYLEGLARPPDGIRRLLRLLTDRYREAGGERRMKAGVKRLVADAGRIRAVELDSGEVLTADVVFSSAGGVETLRLCSDQPADAAAGAVGRLSFVETIQVLDRPTDDFGWRDTIVFFNQAPRFAYARPEELVDPRSGVICFPGNFDYGDEGPAEGVVRTTCLANHDRWAALPEFDYRAAKEHWFAEVAAAARRSLPPVDVAALQAATVATDMFTPTTVRRYTGHLGGAIYGSPEKRPDGRTPYGNLFLIGTDQGYLGIVGAMLSGILVANREGLPR